VNPEIEAFPPIETPRKEEKRTPEQQGLKELCSNTELIFAKRGGREPGVHMWGR
jgi:hypothetical protein